MPDPSPAGEQAAAHLSPDSAARKAGLFLVLTALVTVIAVIGRVATDADQPTLIESLHALASNRFPYAVGGGARLISGVTLGIAAWLLMKTWIIRERLGPPLVPVIFGLSGLFTGLSGALAVAMAVAVPTDLEVPGATWEMTATLREITGQIGFAAAGLSVLIAARYQWRVGGLLRFVAPISAILGLVMQLIWLEAASLVHRYSGSLFLIWLLAIGSMLLTGRVEQHYVILRAKLSPSSNPQT